MVRKGRKGLEGGGTWQHNYLTHLEPSELECSKLQTAFGSLIVSQATYITPVLPP